MLSLLVRNENIIGGLFKTFQQRVRLISVL